MKINRPTFLQIFRGDGFSMFLVWGPLILATFALEFLWDEPDGLSYLLGICTGLVILAGAGLFFRYKKIASIFEDGIVAAGLITGVKTRRGISETSSEVKFTYEYRGEKYQSENTASIEITQHLMVGQAITIILDKNKPSRAFVKELFLD